MRYGYFPDSPLADFWREHDQRAAERRANAKLGIGNKEWLDYSTDKKEVVNATDK